MRNYPVTLLSASDAISTTGSALFVGQAAQASVIPVLSETHAAGTLKLQGSNEIPVGAQEQYVPSNGSFADIPSATSLVTAGVAAAIVLQTLTFQYIRAVYTNTAIYVQSQTVTTVPDTAGSLNSTFFLLSSMNNLTKTQKNWYLWLDDGAGVNPAIAGRTGIHIVYTDNATANTLATSIRVALNALTNDFVATGSSAAVIITDVLAGPVTAAADGSAPTGFTFGSATLGIASGTILASASLLQV